MTATAPARQCPRAQHQSPPNFRTRALPPTAHHTNHRPCVPLRGFAASRLRVRPPASQPPPAISRLSNRRRTNLGLKSPSCSNSHPRTPVRGSPDRTPKTEHRTLPKITPSPARSAAPPRSRPCRLDPTNTPRQCRQGCAEPPNASPTKSHATSQSPAKFPPSSP